MKNFLFILFLLPLFSFAQQKELVYDFVEPDAKFPGGEAAMREFIVNNIVYPEEALKNSEEGVVYVKFIVGSDGQLRDVKIARGISPSLDKEALRVIALMPAWIPGGLNGKPVAVNYTLPIHFRLSKPVNESNN